MSLSLFNTVDCYLLQLGEILKVFFLSDSLSNLKWFPLHKNGPTPASFCLFSVFSIKHYTILQQINLKNVHPVSGAGIQTHNLLYMRLLT